MDSIPDLEDRLRQRVVGQDEAVALVARTIRASRSGLGFPDAPIGRLLFIGPPGTGKTECAKALTEILFGDEGKMIWIDMSECSDEWSLSRLVGIPPGYPNPELCCGVLAESIRRNPCTVVLLDEIEKAHSSVHALLLSIWDEGRFLDGLGRTVDCRNIVMIMTLNARAVRRERQMSDCWPHRPEQEKREDVLRAVRQELDRQFAPEFLDRLDAVVLFDPLSREALDKIAENMIARLPVRVTATPAAINALVEAGFEPAMGARGLRSAVQRLVVEPLAEMILSQQIDRDTPVRLDARQGVLTLAAGAT